MMSKEAACGIVATGMPCLGFAYELMLKQDIAHYLTYSSLPSSKTAINL